MNDPLGTPSLLAVGSDADEDLPAVIWVHTDSPFTDEAGVPYPNQLVDGTGEVHGPWIVCFNSTEAVTLINSDALLRALLLDDRVIRKFPVGALVNYALTEEARVVVDPFLGGGRKFSLAQLRAYLSEQGQRGN